MKESMLQDLSDEADGLRIYEKSLYNAVGVLGNVDHTYGVMSDAVSQALDILEKELKDVAKELESCGDRAIEILYGEESE
tara:strand:- start:552 stop:791 length:240 start_codon:yes stop_codon:yes gene_type:complete